MRCVVITCGFLVASGFIASNASAQMQSGMGSMGSSMGGMGSMGSSMGGMGSMGSSMGGMGSMGSSMGGMGSMGSSMGGMGSMGSSMGGMGGMSGQGQGGQQGGAFLGRNTNQQQFLGQNSAVTGQQGMNGRQNNMMGGNQGGNRAGGNRGNLNTMNNMNNMNGGNAGANANHGPVIHPRLSIGFDHPAPRTEAVQLKLTNHFTKIATPHIGYRGPDRSSFKDISVAMNPGGEAVLSGAVSSRADAKLAENLLRLEPGIRSIKNELKFPEPATVE